MRSGDMVILDNIVETDILSSYKRELCGEAYFVVSSDPLAITILQPLFSNISTNVPHIFVRKGMIYVYTDALVVTTMWGEGM